MNFAISGVHISPLYLVVVGFVVGLLGGFFGVGGSFLAGPALFAAGVPMNFVVGTDLTHIVGKSIVAARKHRTLGNIDFKLGVFMVAGTISGVEAGAQLIQWLKRIARLDFSRRTGPAATKGPKTTAASTLPAPIIRRWRSLLRPSIALACPLMFACQYQALPVYPFGRFCSWHLLAAFSAGFLAVGRAIFECPV